MWPDMTFGDAEPLAAADDVLHAFVMDEDEFRVFYDRNARSLRAYLARITGNSQSADDLLQDAFYRFLRADARYTDEAHRRNSLYRIATNLVRDDRRRKLLHSPLGGDHIERMPALAGGSGSDTRTDVTRAMARLKPNERAMLWLAYAEGASHEEIAAVVGVKPASMKQLLSRARLKLATLLGGRSK